MGRDVVEIRGERIDPGSERSSGAVGAAGSGDGGGGGGGSGPGNPDVVLAPLAEEIGRVGAEGGIAGLSEVQCLLAARWVDFGSGYRARAVSGRFWGGYFFSPPPSHSAPPSMTNDQWCFDTFGGMIGCVSVRGVFGIAVVVGSGVRVLFSGSSWRILVTVFRFVMGLRSSFPPQACLGVWVRLEEIPLLSSPRCLEWIVNNGAFPRLG